MKIVFVTNLVVFHQIGVWDSFIKNLSYNDTFIYLSTSPISAERLKMKYKEEERPYIRKSYVLSDNDLVKIFDDVDLIIIGSVEDKRVNKYLWKAKYCFIAFEHIRKKKTLRSFLSLCRYMLKLKVKGRYTNKYLLAHSSFIGNEFKQFGFNKNHMFQFGYFPKLEIADDYSINNKDPFKLCFCGRFIYWKRPLLAIQILQEFLKYDKRYQLTIIGEGPEKDNILKYISDNNLKDNITLIPFQEHEKVIEIMRESSYYLFTSTKEEGWGAVLNEAMSQGCISIASKKAGSTAFLIENGINGYVFDNTIDIKNIVNKCILNFQLNNVSIQINARNSILNYWNNEVAGDRLFKLIDAIVNKKEWPNYEKGPLRICKN